MNTEDLRPLVTTFNEDQDDDRDDSFTALIPITRRTDGIECQSSYTSRNMATASPKVRDTLTSIGIDASSMMVLNQDDGDDEHDHHHGVSSMDRAVSDNDIDNPVVPELIAGPRGPVEHSHHGLQHAQSRKNLTSTKTMLSVAKEEVELGIKHMDKGLTKPTPTFARWEFQGQGYYDDEKKDVCEKFQNCLTLRKDFTWRPAKYDRREFRIREIPTYQPITPESASSFEKLPYVCEFKEGVMSVSKPGEDSAMYKCPTWSDYCTALTYIVRVSTNGPCKSWAHSRLTVLQTQKRMHTLMNHESELAQSKSVPHRDFYNVRKVDNHVHHSACMNQKHLLRYIKKKMKEPEAETLPIISRNDKEMTLTEVFESLGLTSYDLSIDTLDMHASQTFHRFDKFNLKYNPIGESRLREIFLKYNNKIKGKYLAEITKEVLNDQEANKYQFAEYRLSIYGREYNEWDVLADWVIDNNLSSSNVRWMIQVPRLYSVYKKSKIINSFQDMLTNIFGPLFAVSIDPSISPKLHALLDLVIGFDCVDDESIRTKFFDSKDADPSHWTGDEDPHYCSFLYYLYANLHILNQLRESRGLKTFTLRPHAGEAGDIEHIASSFLCAQSINHGLTLVKSPPIQYLYYLSQSGISMSPLSNNLLFLEYQKNPFPKYFARGLNVALSTDDPLMIHVTKEPLVEEYSVASQVWKLSHIDMCEIARNSVLQSGFEHSFKSHWIGNNYWKRDINGNDIRCTNVPDIRIQFRAELLEKEHKTLAKFAEKDYNPSLIDPIF